MEGTRAAEAGPGSTGRDRVVSDTGEWDTEFVMEAAADDTPVPVDSGCLLLVDPCHVPFALLRELIDAGLATVVPTGGDGLFLPQLVYDPLAPLDTPFISIERVHGELEHE